MTIPAQADHRERLQNALLAIRKLQAKVDALESGRTEPIAVVGLACRFPGGADSPEAFWRLLSEGADAITEVPASRFDVDTYFDPDPDAPGRTYSRWGGFIEDVDRFDAHFFGISPREAITLDPQHRLLLEVGWQALERAGIAPGSLGGSKTGVFMGITGSDYAHLVRTAGAEQLNAYSATGSTSAFVAGRLSYVLGLQGPSVALDTACSSSLGAVHLACQSLRARDCELALAGGVNLMLTPEMWITTSKNRMLSPSGRCHTFDAAADGFVRGEGCGVVVLKRLSSALEAGDPILAVIRGSAMNQDGATSGITVPNKLAQEAVIRDALAAAGVRPHEVQYVEAHGTGTSLGDPLELRALGAVLGAGRAAEAPFLVGSVKTNIGHLEAASGIAGLIKTVLMLRHREIPPHLHFHHPSPHIPWAEIPARVPAARTPWESSEARRTAGVSSFGASGTNIHLVVEEYGREEGRGKREEGNQRSEERGARSEGAEERRSGGAKERGVSNSSFILHPSSFGTERPLHLLPLSAKTPEALRELAERYAVHLEQADDPVADLCFTAGAGRTHFGHRLAVLGADAAQMAERLDGFLASEGAPGVVSGEVGPGVQPRVAFLFTGQGAQYVNMGRQLYESEPSFRATLQRCDELLRPRLERPLLSVLYPTQGEEAEAARLLDRTAYTQPALFALEYALCELWRSWGIQPAAVLGHSVGEYVAACVAGVFSLEDGLTLIAERGRLMQALPEGGAMVAVRGEAELVSELITPYAETVSLAAVNGPRSVVISGAAADLERIVAALRERGIDCKPLSVSHAFHSPLLDPALAALEAAAGQVSLHPPKLRLVSNLTGEVAAAEMTYPTYWRRHAREPVQFARGAQTLADLGCDTLLEIGPAPVLLGMVREAEEQRTGGAEEQMGPGARDGELGAGSAATPVAGENEPGLSHSRTHALTHVHSLASLRRGRDDWAQLLESVARLYAAGAPFDWAAFERGRGRRKVWAPTYPFQGGRYWIEARPSAVAAPVRGARVHPLLGTPLHAAGRQKIWEAQLGAGTPAYLADHRVHGEVVLPATAYLEMAAAAATDLLGGLAELRDVVLHEPLALPEDGTATVQLVATPENGERMSFEVFSLAEVDRADGWRLHASGAATRASEEAGEAAAVSLPDLGASLPRELPAAEHYAAMAARGLDFGPTFRGVAQLRCGPDEALGEARLPEPVLDEPAYRIHPVLLDACLQAVGAALSAPAGESYLPLSLGRLRLHGPLSGTVWSHATFRTPEPNTATRIADLRVYDSDSRLLLEVDGLALRPVARADRPATPEEIAGWLYDVTWEPQQPSSPPAGEGPGQEDLAALLAPAAARAAALDASPDAALLRSFTPELDHLCGAYAAEALRELGWQPSPGEDVTEAGLTARLGIAGRYRRLLGRMLEMLAEDGALVTTAHGWRVLREPEYRGPAALLAELRQRFPESASELGILGRCGAALAATLRGERDPLELLFPGGSLAETERMYQASPFTREPNSLVGASVAAVVGALPTDRRLRVLEVGGGTGGTTTHLLPQLPAERTDYTFTDISPLFVEKARVKFRDYPFLHSRTLDIAADAANQGFAPGSFEVIVASNVLHATPDLRQTLDRVRELLAPGGVLVLLEGVERQRFADLTVGLTDGWWCYADEELRSYALVGHEQWLELLREQGLDAIAIAGPGPFAAQAVLVARAPRAIPATSTPGTWLLLSDSGPVGPGLATRLEARGERCVLLRPGAPVDPTTFRELLRELTDAGQPPLRGVVHLWALEDGETASHAADPRAEALDEAQLRVTGSALHLVQALAGAGAAPRLWLVTRGAQAVADLEPVAPTHASLWGLGRVIALEHPELRCTRVDLDRMGGDGEVEDLFAELQAGSKEDQVALRGADRFVARLARRESDAHPALALADGQPYQLRSAGPKVLDSLELSPLARQAPGAGEVEVEVLATGLTFRDVLNALGQYPDAEAPLGGELAGVVTAVGEGVAEFAVGDVVLGIAFGAFRSHVVTRAELVVRKPDGLTLAEAAALPSAFLTARYALHRLARLEAGQRVLIHAGAGGVGMAAIQLAQRAGAEVFATAGSERKRQHLRSLGVSHVFDSRSPGFADEVLRATGGRGVDVVLNSLADEFIPRSLEALVDDGRFVELGKRGIWDAARVAEVRPGAEYFVVDLAADSVRQPELIRGLLQEVVPEFASGALRPLPVTCFPIADAVSAFRFMAQARHIGKVVVTHTRVPTVRRDGTYLITGGLGGVGLSTARWLAEQGAGHLVLVGRSAPSDAAHAALAEIESAGAQVTALQVDVSSPEQLDHVFEQLRTLPPLRGVFHSALVLDDGALVQQSWQRFRKVMAPRVTGGWLLHTRTAGLPLDFFVVHSAAGSLLGSPGQGNYTAANTYLDALVQHRRSLGLPGLSVQWGAWEQVGRAAALGFGERARQRGIGTMTPRQALSALEVVMRQLHARPQVAVMQVDWSVFLEAAGAQRSPPFFAALAAEVSQRTVTAPAAAVARPAEPRRDLRRELDAAPPARRTSLLSGHVRAQVVKVLSLDPSHPLDARQPLQEMGLDSLMAVELRTLLGAGLELPRGLPATLAFDYPSIEAIAGFLARELFGAPLEPAALAANGGARGNGEDGAANADVATSADLEDLTDAEAEALLLAELESLRPGKA